MNDLTVFEIGSAIHVVAILGCAAITAVVAVLANRHRENPRITRSIRAFIVAGCLLSWLLSNGFGFLPAYFSWEQSLPLHFCNLANLIGAVAIWKRYRPAQSLLYFWAFGLSVWALLTPSLGEGPATVWFWLFWLYHLFIFVSATVVLVDGFRPTWVDFRQSLGFTLLYMFLLALLDRATGWNYGFVGEGKPLQPSPLDALGPYPLRLLWMALIGTAIFALLMLPWLRQRPEAGAKP